MNNAYFSISKPKNESILTYLPGSAERISLKEELVHQSQAKITIPLIIGGKEVFTNSKKTCVMPHDHQHVLAEYCIAGEAELKMAIEAAEKAKEEWASMPWEHRASIFLKAADLISGPYRNKLNAATMLGQSKTVIQAEIDSACEICDFLRFNTYFAQEIYKNQPESSEGIWNKSEYRPLEGFVVAISPFNFTAIGGNLASAPAILGNTVLWKPSSSSILSNYYLMQVLMEAGLPAGVINFIPSRGTDISKYVLTHPKMAGFHFTGSTDVFSGVWSLIGENIKSYNSYPKIVGETGGKDFVFAHSSANVPALVTALVRGAYEYQGQKCSAASRAFIPEKIWPEVEARLKEEIAKIKVGDVCDFTNFMGAVIDESSFNKIKKYIDDAKESENAEVICGKYDNSKGWFVEPTLIRAYNPRYKTMIEEIFGPVLTIYVYKDEELDEVLNICDTSSPYALTGAIFAQDRSAIIKMEKALSNSAGNFYINDKPTGAVVGQQPFGGARSSGTNDKAGSMLNMLRWASPRTIKESFVPPTKIDYPFMSEV